ncbi:MAG: T9SS type A sorting domain-containing protein [Fibromonadales bacterium]|nr:T9SS type A sorting domain-containing protein [Fibromonadales bacterium]
MRKGKVSIVCSFFAVLLVLVVQSVFAQDVWDGTVDTTWYTNNKSASEFTITTAEQLAGLAGLVNGGNDFSDKIVMLGNNITLNDTTNWKNWNEDNAPTNTWTPIGTYSNSVSNNLFKGTFDGNNFVVSGIYINSTSDYQGLFKRISFSATIKNLGVVASYIKGRDYVGGLVGANDGTTCMISNCHAAVTVIGTNNVGGLVGINTCNVRSSYSLSTITGISGVGGLMGINFSEYSTVSNSYSSGVVTGANNVGGLAGKNSSNGKINNSYSIGYVMGVDNVGGLVGDNSASAIDNSYSAAEVIGTGNFIGGLAGVGGRISNSYSIGDVTGTDYVGGLAGNGIIKNSYSIGLVKGRNRVGGLVGEGSNISGSYYNKETSGQNDVGKGEGKTTAEMKLQSTFIDWRFYFIWGINNEINGGYPYLKNEISIKTMGQLVEFAELVNGGYDFFGQTIKLEQDIVINDTTNWKNWDREPPTNEWISIGTYSLGKDYLFNGTFEGNNFVISGIYFNNIYLVGHQSSYKGLFGNVGSYGIIKNLGIAASYIKGIQYIGGLAGFNNGTISNSYFTGIVSGNNNVGGLVGINRGVINSSYSIAMIISTEDSETRIIGGLVGNNNGIINNSYSAGTVTARNAFYVGGLVGENYSGVINSSYSTSMVTGHTHVGGFLGINISSGKVINCYSMGTVIGISYVGGLVGINRGVINSSYSISRVLGEAMVSGLIGENGGAINNSYYEGQTNDEGKGEGKTMAEMKQQSTFIDWNFSGIWGIDSKINCGYPYLLSIEYNEGCNNNTPIRQPQITANKIFAYATSNFIVLGNLPKNSKVEIYNLQGKLISNKSGSDNLQIMVHAKGIYIVNVGMKTFRVAVR